MTAPGVLESALRRDRVIVAVALAAVTALAWAYVLAGAGTGMPALDMTRASRAPMSVGSDGPMGMGVAAPGTPAMPVPGTAAPAERSAGASMSMPGEQAEGDVGMAMMAPAAWTPGYALLMFCMWWVMMVAMMLPSAAPMILLFATVNRKQRERGGPFVPTGVFAGGYLLVWAAFSLVAVALQWGFERLAWLSPTMVGTSTVLGGLILLAAGLYQLTPIKQACLRHCRHPIQFLTTRWRRGTRGALMMGFEHGTFCVGCCWFLMGLLFFGGVMNLFWIGGIALFVLAERTVPAGHWLGYATGVALVGWGVAVLAGAA